MEWVGLVFVVVALSFLGDSHDDDNDQEVSICILSHCKIEIVNTKD